MIFVPKVLAWQEKAACRGADPEWFFSAAPDEVLAAKAICAGCPVRAQCAGHAQAEPEHYGVWGGIDLDEQRRAARRAMRRPRKDRARVR